MHPKTFVNFFPRAPERRVLLRVEVCYTSAHLHTSSHIFTHLHTSSLSLSLSLSLALCHGSLKAAGSAYDAPRYGHPFARNEVRVSETQMFFRIYFCCSNLFARNEVRVSNLRLWRFYNFPRNPFAQNEVRVSKTKVFLRLATLSLKN